MFTSMRLLVYEELFSSSPAHRFTHHGRELSVNTGMVLCWESMRILDNTRRIFLGFHDICGRRQILRAAFSSSVGVGEFRCVSWHVMSFYLAKG